MSKNRIRTLFSVACIASTLLAAAGCTSVPHGSVNLYTGGEGARSMQSVEKNSMLAGDIKIANPITTRKNELMLVQFDLVNQRSAQIMFQWTVDWYDKQGLKVPDATQHWEPVVMPGYASNTISIVAPNAAATQWQLQIGSRDEVQ
jgi:uncharacterized protein YcfL